MGIYVDAVVTPVSKRQMATYLRIARTFARVWRKCGALEYRECVADDVSVGKRTSFPRSVKQRPGEVVCLTLTLYKSRRHRDQVNAKAMKDPRIAPFMKSKKLPFDGKRLYFGGFKAILAK
jgi:uncharacterized protein YbaA (DUF1428 family)